MELWDSELGQNETSKIWELQIIIGLSSRILLLINVDIYQNMASMLMVKYRPAIDL